MNKLDSLKLLLTCTNDPVNGGVYLCEPTVGSFTRIHDAQCMGIARFHQYYVIASQSLEVARQLREGKIKWTPQLPVPHALICLNQNFELVSETPLSVLGMGDLHDLAIRRAH